MYTRMAVAVLVLGLSFGCAMFDRTAVRDLGENDGVLQITSNVKGAEVYVDDALYGMIMSAGRPQSIVIPAGKHDLAVAKFGYKSFSAHIAVEKGMVNTLLVDLERLPTEVVTVPESKPAAPKE